jgi:hypothetical protein
MDSEEVTHSIPVFDIGWFHKEVPGKRTPLLKALGFTEEDHVMINALPIDTQSIGRAIFLNPLKTHAMAAFSGAKMSGSFTNSGFKLSGLGRVDFQKCNFSNHGVQMARCKEAGKS